jgi:hypothetical protein
MVIFPLVDSNDDYLNLVHSKGLPQAGIDRRARSFRFFARNPGVPFNSATYELSVGCGHF